VEEAKSIGTARVLAKPCTATQTGAFVRRTPSPTVAGILAIISSLLEGGVVVGVLLSLSPFANYTPLESAYVGIVFITNVLGFVLGLTAGIQSIRRRNFRFTVVGICFLLAGNIVSIRDFLFLYYQITQSFNLLILLMILPVLSLILVSISKREFTHVTKKEMKKEL